MDVSNSSGGQSESHVQSDLVIGFVVGHEIAHGFDEARRHYNSDGNYDGLWSQETNDMFGERSDCLIKQYNNYTIPQIGLQVGYCE